MVTFRALDFSQDSDHRARIDQIKSGAVKSSRNHRACLASALDSLTEILRARGAPARLEHIRHPVGPILDRPFAVVARAVFDGTDPLLECGLTEVGLSVDLRENRLLSSLAQVILVPKADQDTRWFAGISHAVDLLRCAGNAGVVAARPGE